MPKTIRSIVVLSAVGVSTVVYDRLAYAEILTCNNIDGGQITQQLSGQISFRGSNLRYWSQVERTDSKGIQRYRYCIDNHHAYSPVVVQWSNRKEANDIVFDGIVPPQVQSVQYFDVVEAQEIRELQLDYGLRKKEWDDQKKLDTIHKRQSSTSLLLRAAFDPANDSTPVPSILKDRVLLESILDQGKTIRLQSGAIIRIPSTILALRYLNDPDFKDIPDQLTFVPVELHFESLVTRYGSDYLLANEATFEVTDPKLFAAAQSMSAVSFSIPELDGKLGKLKFYDSYPLKSGKLKDAWFDAEQTIDGPLGETMANILISGPDNLPIATFPFSTLIPIKPGG
jgi:hypothetical protein